MIQIVSFVFVIGIGGILAGEIKNLLDLALAFFYSFVIYILITLFFVYLAPLEIVKKDKEKKK
jgi:hypothetical protein